MILKTIENKDTYPMARGKRWFKWEVKIPNGVVCNHCMLQVRLINLSKRTYSK